MKDPQPSGANDFFWRQGFDTHTHTHKLPTPDRRSFPVLSLAQVGLQSFSKGCWSFSASKSKACIANNH